MEKIGEALRSLRGSVSQADLAQRAGISASALNRAELGRHSPSVETADAILIALGKDAHDLAAALDRVQGRAPSEQTTGAS